MAPSCFWITNPDNVLIGNHAVGCVHGFWFDLASHSGGPSASRFICPNATPLGEFRDNVAHSNSKSGLQIDKFKPRVNPCASIVEEDDANLWVTAYFESFRGYKNSRGIDALAGGALVFLNCQLSDNRMIGISIRESFNSDYDIGYIDGALVVGRTMNNSGVPTDVQVPG